MFQGFTASYTTEPDFFYIFIFYNLQTNPKNTFIVNIRLYHCLKYYKTVHSLSVLVNYVPNEVFICFNQSFVKVTFISQSVTNLDPHITTENRGLYAES